MNLKDLISNQKFRTTLIASVTGLVSYKIGTISWERKKMHQSLNNVIMLSNLYKEIAEWCGEDGQRLSPYDLKLILHEKLSFVALASKATD